MYLPSMFSQLYGTSNAIWVVQNRIRGREWILANIDSQGHVYVRYMRCISIQRFGGVVTCYHSRPGYLFGTITIICGCPGLSRETQLSTIYGQIWRGQSWTAHMSVMVPYSQSMLGTEHIPTNFFVPSQTVTLVSNVYMVPVHVPYCRSKRKCRDSAKSRLDLRPQRAVGNVSDP